MWLEPVRWTRDDHFVVSVTDSAIRIECKAAGFPTPRFIWYRNDEIIEGAEGYILEVVRFWSETLKIKFLLQFRCECSILYKYRCRVWNEVPEGYTFSEFYRRNGKQFSSSLDSDECDISSFTREDYKCDQCKSGAYDHLRQIMNIEKFGKGMSFLHLMKSCNNLYSLSWKSAFRGWNRPFGCSRQSCFDHQQLHIFALAWISHPIMRRRNISYGSAGHGIQNCRPCWSDAGRDEIRCEGI